MKKGKKIFLVILFILIIGSLGILVYKLSDKKETPKNEAAVVDKIEGFNYSLDDRDTKLYKDEFSTLKGILESSTIDYEKYAQSLAKMFVIDFYTLNNKINKYDIGSLELVHSEILENFKLKAIDTIYKYVMDDSEHERDQALPEVSSVTVTDIKEDNYKMGDKTVEAYIVTLNWSYVTDMKYDNKAVMALVKENNKLVVVEFDTTVK